MTSWVQQLQEYTKGTKPKNKKELKEEVELKFLQNLEKKKQQQTKNKDEIPRFFFPTKSPIKELIKKCARKRKLKKKKIKLLDPKDIEQLLNSVKKHSVEENEELIIDYEAFCSVQDEVSPKCKRILKPSLFLKFQDPLNGNVSSFNLLKYIINLSTFKKRLIDMSFLTENEWLTRTQIEIYIKKLIPKIPDLDNLGFSFRKYYIQMSCQKFLYFRGNSQKMRVLDFALSKDLELLNELVDNYSGEEFEENWFSKSSAELVINEFLNLQDNQDKGYLTQNEFISFGTGLIPEFAERLFQEHIPDGRMTFQHYVNYVLISTYYSEYPKKSFEYLWKIIDINKNGKFDELVLKFFFKGLIRQLKERNMEEVTFSSFMSEIFDLFKPKYYNFISKQDLLRSNSSVVLFRILGDVDEFVTWDERSTNNIDQM
ncbi:serine/threonine-protein phosphatase 2a regulatory subunit b'' subunit gamma [Anaeramoeba flamelloides]|uniref:Serine/threonine-protein phosphatase 2a regulatory subunit b'' subunit gamma n=1 Tax=Anaeramoeba flamelloides TaxID=1746091 RepID=A0ABQ8ZED8_9EUKA|nr:serine/threonine-protein phosphatase 2a regulatory subunit b'' subunit gamma [Anaeramoeba flamelloides]